jgi:hypothetical protein
MEGEASLSLCAAKVTAAGNSHIFGLYCCRPSKLLFDSRDTDKVPREGFPMRRLMRRLDGKEAKGNEARLLEWRAGVVRGRLTDARI